MNPTVPIHIGPSTKFIVSTSGRLKSIERYSALLHNILRVDIAYFPINSGDDSNKAIDPSRFTSALRGLPCIGGAISRDIKQSVIPFLDELDETASNINAVNTIIVHPHGKLKGYNTDVTGFKKAIVDGIDKFNLHIETAVCYGYGGVTAVVVYVLQSLGISVYIAGRNMELAAAKASKCLAFVWTKDQKVDLFVNATPASEHPLCEAANFIEALHNAKLVFDHEMPGQFLREYCESNKISYIPGTDMYYPQMYAQWSLFLDSIVDVETIPNLIAQAESMIK